MMMTSISNSRLVFVCFSVIVGLIPAADVNKAPTIGNPFLIHAKFHLNQFTRLNFGHRLAQSVNEIMGTVSKLQNVLLG